MTTEEMFSLMREAAVEIASREAWHVLEMRACGHPPESTPMLSRETVLMLATVISVESSRAMAAAVAGCRVETEAPKEEE